MSGPPIASGSIQRDGESDEQYAERLLRYLNSCKRDPDFIEALEAAHPGYTAELFIHWKKKND